MRSKSLHTVDFIYHFYVMCSFRLNNRPKVKVTFQRAYVFTQIYSSNVCWWYWLIVRVLKAKSVNMRRQLYTTTKISEHEKTILDHQNQWTWENNTWPSKSLNIRRQYLTTKICEHGETNTWPTKSVNMWRQRLDHQTQWARGDKYMATKISEHEQTSNWLPKYFDW